MLKYTFSKREKVLLVALALILIGLCWYYFVFSNVNTQMIDIESQIEDAQIQAQASMQQVAKMNTMEEEVSQQTKSGVSPETIPAYNALPAEMQLLDQAFAIEGIEYQIAIDDITQVSTGLIGRGCTISVNYVDYPNAKKILDTIAASSLPTAIDSFKAGTASGNSISSIITALSGTSITRSNASFHVTFFERSDTPVENLK